MVSVDVGEYDNIHPIDKKPIGERLALAALANEYGVDVKWESPKLEKIEKNGEKYILSFKNAESLVSKNGSPSGFFITAKSGEHLLCDAKISGNVIQIDARDDAVAIGYCDINFCKANVFNEAGLPLFPFRREL